MSSYISNKKHLKNLFLNTFIGVIMLFFSLVMLWVIRDFSFYGDFTYNLSLITVVLMCLMGVVVFFDYLALFIIHYKEIRQARIKRLSVLTNTISNYKKEAIKKDKEIIKLSDRIKTLTTDRILFKKEDMLEDFIYHHHESIDLGFGKMNLIGKQVWTGRWRIDLVFTDVFGNYIIIELKRGKSPDATLGQTARYMTWVKRKYNLDKKKVFGVILGAKISDELKYACDEIENITCLEYGIHLDLNKVKLLEL